MEICTVGGFEEVGKNMTAIKIGEDVFICDAGINLPPLIELQENETPPVQGYSEKKLRSIGAIPDDLILDKLGWTDKVRAIFISHAHLDHVGAVPYIAKRYPNAEIAGTPFTMAILEDLIKDAKISLRNKRTSVKPDGRIFINGKSERYKIDFIHTTHSTLQCTFIAIHSKEGTFFYALDFKFDNFPTMGKPPSYGKFKEIARKGIKVLVVDSLYSGVEKRSGSERIAQHLLEEAFSIARNKNGALFVTTFSSHIERLNNIVKFGKRTNRQIIFLGRSLAKYVDAAIKVGECPFKNKVKVIRYRRQVESILRKVNRERGKYLVVCTGHQGEPGSIMDRIVNGKTGFNFKEGDNVIFSSSVIPVPINVLARDKMDKKLRKMGVKVQTDIHVHGHGSREGLRELIEILHPEHIIPAHGSLEQEAPMIDLAGEFGYKFGETSHLTSNGKVLKF